MNADFLDPNALSVLSVNRMRPYVDAKDPQLQVNAMLRKYDWEVLDAAVYDTAHEQLMVVDDLVERGLTVDLGGLGAIYSTYEMLPEMASANIDMAADTEGENDRASFAPISVPIPIIHKPFTLNLRQIDAARRSGQPLDVTHVIGATRAVRVSLENMVVNGSTINVAGNTIAGFTTAPQRISNTATNFGGGDFGTEGNGYKTINGMVNELAQDGFAGPYGAYVSRTQYGQLTRRFTDGSGQTELTALVSLVPGLQYVKPSDRLADGNVVVVQLTRDVIDLAIAQDIIPVMWQEKGGLVSKFIVMGAMAPRIKTDGSKTGVAHATGA